MENKFHTFEVLNATMDMAIAKLDKAVNKAVATIDASNGQLKRAIIQKPDSYKQVHGKLKSPS